MAHPNHTFNANALKQPAPQALQDILHTLGIECNTDELLVFAHTSQLFDPLVVCLDHQALPMAVHHQGLQELQQKCSNKPLYLVTSGRLHRLTPQSLQTLLEHFPTHHTLEDHTGELNLIHHTGQGKETITEFKPRDLLQLKCKLQKLSLVRTDLQEHIPLYWTHMEQKTIQEFLLNPPTTESPEHTP